MKECLQTAWDHGINTFDTAEVRKGTRLGIHVGWEG